jgi:hypothetical protein
MRSIAFGSSLFSQTVVPAKFPGSEKIHRLDLLMNKAINLFDDCGGQLMRSIKVEAAR